MIALMVDIPEEEQAAALRAVATCAQERDQAESWMTERVRLAAVAAVQTGAQRSRIAKLAGVSPNTFYGWLADAGVEVRAKKAPAKKAGAK
jgi:transposase-like protein